MIPFWVYTMLLFPVISFIGILGIVCISDFFKERQPHTAIGSIGLLLILGALFGAALI